MGEQARRKLILNLREEGESDDYDYDAAARFRARKSRNVNNININSPVNNNSTVKNNSPVNNNSSVNNNSHNNSPNNNNNESINNEPRRSNRKRKKKIFEDYEIEGSTVHGDKKEEKSTNRKEKKKETKTKIKIDVRPNNVIKVKEEAKDNGKKIIRKKRRTEEDKDEQRKEYDDLIKTRDKRMKDRLAELNAGQMRELLAELAIYHPALILAILEKDQHQGGGGGGGYHPGESAKAPEWCKCHNCREMPTAVERRCCGYIPRNCLSKEPEMSILVLEPMVLRLARNYRNDFMAEQDDNDEKRALRHAAYRQFILWQHGYIGRGDRRVVPSCVTWKIRDKFPDAFGQYAGFKPNEQV